MIYCTLIHLRQNSKTLMIEKKNGMFMGVGGKFEKGETPEQCLIREVKEETNLDIEEFKLVGEIFFPKFDDEKDYYVYVYEGIKFSGEMKESSEGKLYWIDDNKITDLNIWEGDEYFLDWIYNKRTFFKATFYYENGKYIKYDVEFGEKYD